MAPWKYRVCVALMPEVGFVRGNKKSMCIFNFYGHCPNSRSRGSANSRYTLVRSDLFPPCQASSPMGARLWVEEWYPINCVYVVFALTQIWGSESVCGRPTESLFLKEMNMLFACVCYWSFYYWFVGTLHRFWHESFVGCLYCKHLLSLCGLPLYSFSDVCPRPLFLLGAS